MAKKCGDLHKIPSGITYQCLRLADHDGKHKHVGITWDNEKEKSMGFNEGDRVRIDEDSAHSKAGELGTVTHVYDVNRTAYRVKLDSGNESSFFGTELWPVDEKREALITLAETLDTARKQANAISIPVIESQRGVYGQIELSLVDTLEAYFEGQVDDTSLFANATLNSMVDSGNTVREALKAVVKNDYNEQGNR